MRAIVRYLRPSPQINKRPYLIIDQQPKAGDFVCGYDDTVIQVNQSTCVLFDKTVLHVTNDALQLQDGEVVNIAWWCRKLNDCAYPFCGSSCGGSSKDFYIIEHEKRPFDQ